jgi:hypothetical protein
MRGGTIGGCIWTILKVKVTETAGAITDNGRFGKTDKGLTPIFQTGTIDGFRKVSRRGLGKEKNIGKNDDHC